MSVSIRISDDTYDEIMELKSKNVSINKTADMILQLAIRGISKYKISLDDYHNGNSGVEEFSERIKRMAECIFEELKECDNKLQNQNEENEKKDFDESENENSKMRITELENQILDLKKSEEYFLKIENEIEKISDLIMENRKVIIEKIKSDDEVLTDTDVDYTTLISVKSEQTYLMVSEKEQYPFILPDDKKPWCYMKWHVNEKFNTATLEYNYNPLATADVLHQKIMLITPLEQQIWYPHEGDMQTLMYICERRLLKTFNDKLPLWFQKGIQFVHDPDYTENLYAEQRKINEERKKRGLYEFESFRF